MFFFGVFEKFETFLSKICAHSERYRNTLAGIFEIPTFYGNIAFPSSPVLYYSFFFFLFVFDPRSFFFAFLFCLSSLLVVTQIRGHTEQGLFSPLPTADLVFAFLSREDFSPFFPGRLRKRIGHSGAQVSVQSCCCISPRNFFVWLVFFLCVFVPGTLAPDVFAYVDSCTFFPFFCVIGRSVTT